MRKLLWILSLVALLVGPLMRMAEAADDLARELAETPQTVGLEEPDGGVGDESAESIRTAGLSESWTQTQAELPVQSWLIGMSSPRSTVCVRTNSPTSQPAPPWLGGVARVVLFCCFLC